MADENTVPEPSRARIAQRDSDDFTFTVEHVGVDLDFHHPRGRDLNPAPDVVEAFERDREHAEIFIQNSSGLGFSCDEILDWFLLQSGSTLADHMPQGALENARHGDSATKVMLTVPIRLAPGTFHMATEDGAVDLAALKLMCKVSVHARGS